MKPSKETLQKAGFAIERALHRWGIPIDEMGAIRLAEAALTAAMEPCTLEDMTGYDEPYGLIRLEDE